MAETLVYLRHVDEHVAHGVGVRQWHCDHHVRRTQLLLLLRVGRRLAFALFHVLARENLNLTLIKLSQILFLFWGINVYFW